MLQRSREHKVIDGDSLEWLAEKYSTTVSALKRLNNLQDDIIYTGSVLKICKQQTLRTFQVFGRSFTARDGNGNALPEGSVLNTTQPVKAQSTSISSFKTYPFLQRGQCLKPLPPLKTVRVRFGDTLADIAYEHGLSIRELQQLNNLRNDVIFEGDVLAVSAGPVERCFVDIRPGPRRTNRLLFSRRRDCEITFGTGSSQSIPKAKELADVKVQGHWGKKKKKGFKCHQERWLRFSSPLMDGIISSPFGWRWGAFHEGVDLAADQGAPIFASERGTVTFAGWSSGYGYLIAIQHEGGFLTRYAHCCAIHARIGQQVSKGQQVAAVGATGRATGPHVHFEVRRNGEALDPFKWVRL